MTTQQFCTFFVEGIQFGIEVLKVQEVLKYHETTPVPLAAPVVHGLINLRGQIVTALDLRTRLSLPVRPESSLPMNVVIRSDGGAVSLLVDEIGDVLEATEELFEEPPATLAPQARDLIRGVYKLEHRLLLILDTDRTLSVESMGQTQETA
ncbi:MAG: chemotaxis protein CheW [Myxococcales bacterium]|nr:chemotaxis protein CheW [Myxococcales bacterium]